jgi:hypothetical protein
MWPYRKRKEVWKNKQEVLEAKPAVRTSLNRVVLPNHRGAWEMQFGSSSKKKRHGQQHYQFKCHHLCETLLAFPLEKISTKVREVT